MTTLNAQQLANAIVQDWFVNGAVPSDAIKITAREAQTNSLISGR